MIKAILFDLFETLITESEESPRRASTLGPDLQIETERFRLEWKARRPAVVRGELSLSQALAQIVAAAGRPVHSLSIERLCRERAHAMAMAFDHIEPQILSMVHELRNRGTRLGVISNCFAEDVQAWPTCSLSVLFDCALFSFEAHLAKPDPRIYEEACRQLAVDPAATIYISDGTYEELMAAENAGIQSFQALWYLKRWTNFRHVCLYTRTLLNAEDVFRLI